MFVSTLRDAAVDNLGTCCVSALVDRVICWLGSGDTCHGSFTIAAGLTSLRICSAVRSNFSPLLRLLQLLFQWVFLSLIFSMAVLSSSARLMYLLMIPSSFMAAMYAAVLLSCLAAALALNTLLFDLGSDVLLLARHFILILVGPGSAKNLPRVHKSY